jgi:hypothetical protein
MTRYGSDSRLYEKNNCVSLSYHEDSIASDYFYITNSDSSWQKLTMSPIEGLSPIYDHRYFFKVSDDTLITLFASPNPYDNYNPHKRNYGIYFSSDRGKKWDKRDAGIDKPQSDGQYYYHLYKQGSRYILMVIDHDTVTGKGIAKFYKTDNYGILWETLPRPVPDSVGGEFKVLSDSLCCYTYDRRLYFSTDRGDTWFQGKSPLPDSFLQPLSRLFKLANKLILCCQIKDSPVTYESYQSWNNGVDWSRIYPPDVFAEIRSLYGDGNVFNINDSYLTDSLFQRADHVRESETALDGPWYNLVYIEGSTLYSFYFQDSIQRSTDNGVTWGKYMFHDGDYLLPVRWVKNQGILYALGKDKISLKQNIYVSLSTGSTWQKLAELPTDQEVTSLKVTHGAIFVDRFVSTDKGASWRLIEGPYQQSLNEQFIVYDDGLLRFIPNESYNYYSTDLGKSWNETYCVNFPLGSFVAPIFSAAGRLFAFTAIAGFKSYFNVSIDSGVSWVQVTNGIRSDLDFIPTHFEDGLLYAIGKKGSKQSMAANYQLYVSRDSGMSWMKLGDSVLNGDKLFVGADYYFLSGGNELWRLPKTIIPTMVRTSKRLSSKHIICYPIPATNILNIISNPSEVIQDVELYDVAGRKVSITPDIHRSSAQLKDFELPTGYYLLKVLLSGEHLTEPILIRK